MQLYATLLGILLMLVTCQPMEMPLTTISPIDRLIMNLKGNMRTKRTLPVLETVGDVIHRVGSGLLGLNIGLQHGAQSTHLQDYGYNPDYGYGYGRGYGNGYYGPRYGNGYYGPSYGNGYYGPSYGHGYYVPVLPYNNGYYG